MGKYSLMNTLLLTIINSMPLSQSNEKTIYESKS